MRAGESFKLEKISPMLESRPDPLSLGSFSFGSFAGFCFLFFFILPFSTGAVPGRLGGKTEVGALLV
jgi:hypothetical protein